MISRVRRSTAAFVAALALTGVLATPTAYAQPPSPLAIPVTGLIEGVASFAGTFNLTRFAVQNGGVVAIGTLTGTLTDLVNGVTTSIVRNVAVPIAEVTQATCEILNLELGPIHLDLLGLVVDLNEVVLNITAEPGPGNLLGNLLCAVAGLLDNPNGLARLLNNLLRALTRV
jgi:hypothetical protein